MREQQTAALAQALAAVPEEAIQAALLRLEQAPRVFVCAAGRSGLMLRAFAMRLAQAGRIAYVAGETITPAIEAGDLLVLASASGSTHSVLHAAQVAQGCGAELLVISAKAHSPLAAIHPVELLLPAPDKDSAGSASIMGTLFEQALLLLMDELVQRMQPAAGDMRKRHANLE